MRLRRNEEELGLREGIAKLAAGATDISRPAAQNASVFWSGLVEGGWLGIALPEERGGFAGSATDIASVMEAAGHGALITHFLPNVLIAARLLAWAPECHEYHDILAAIIAGESALAAVATGDWDESWPITAREEAGGWSLTGTAPPVYGAEHAENLVIQARLADGGVGYFLAASRTPGIVARSFPTLRGVPATSFTFDITVPASARLDISAAAASAVFNQALAGACWEAVGAMDYLLRTTAEYVAMRHQFGKPLSSFQVVQHRLAEMSAQCEIARAAALLASLATGNVARATSHAKIVTSKAARQVSQNAVQLHGGMGVTEELAVGTYFRLLTSFDALLGTPEQHLARSWKVAIEPGDFRKSAVLG